MGLETGTYINSLNANNPVNATDVVGQGDDHLRLIKSTILNTFPNISGAMTLTHTELNDAARKAVTNTFLAQQRIEATNPMLVMKDTDATLDEKVTRLNNSSDQFRLQFLNDAESSAQNVIAITRNGQQVGTTTFYNGTVSRLTIDGSGQVAIRSDGNTDTEARRLMFERQDGTVRAFIGHLLDGDLQLYNQVHGSGIDLVAEDAGGVARTLATFDPDGPSAFYHDGTLRARTSSAQLGMIELYGGVNTATPPTTEAMIAGLRMIDGDNTDLVGVVGFESSNELRIRNYMHGGLVAIRGEDSSGNARTLATFEPSGPIQFYRDGFVTFRCATAGVIGVRGDLSVANDARRIDFEYQNGTLAALVGHNGSDVFLVQNREHGGNVQISGEDAGGTARIFLLGDPDADTRVRGDTELTLQVGGSVDMCKIDTTGAITTRDNNASEFGYKGAPVNVQNGNYTLALTDCGKTVRKESGGAGETYTVPATGTWPIGTIIVIHNDGGGDLSINGSGATTLEEWNGSTGNKTLPDNNKAILEYVGGNAWKYSATG